MKNIKNKIIKIAALSILCIATQGYASLFEAGADLFKRQFRLKDNGPHVIVEKSFASELAEKLYHLRTFDRKLFVYFCEKLVREFEFAEFDSFRGQSVVHLAFGSKAPDKERYLIRDYIELFQKIYQDQEVEKCCSETNCKNLIIKIISTLNEREQGSSIENEFANSSLGIDMFRNQYEDKKEFFAMSKKHLEKALRNILHEIKIEIDEQERKINRKKICSLFQRCKNACSEAYGLGKQALQPGNIVRGVACVGFAAGLVSGICNNV